mgnify:FL=1
MTPHSPEAGSGAASNQLATLRVTPVRCADEPSFELTHPYFELVYGSIVGPAAVQVARHLGHRLADETGPIEVNLAAFAQDLGLRSSSDKPLGKRSHLRHAIDRLEHTHIVQWLSKDHLAIQTHVPAVADATVARLPEAAAQAHHRFVGDSPGASRR